jgi:hypothetical protein
MGAGQSKQAGDKKAFKDMKPLDAIHQIATKYILTQNFKDLEYLSNPEYCDKLVILTSDVIRNFIKSEDTEYLAHSINDGVPVNRQITEKLMYFDLNEDTNIKSKNITQKYVQEPLKGFVPVPIKTKKKNLFQKLDVKDKKNKDRMCKGIAKFYIKIAHIFSSILKTVNPVFTYTENGKVHRYSIANKNKIPPNANVKLSESNLCTRRINALNYSKEGENFKINQKASCSLNKKTTTQSDSDLLSEWEKTISLSKTLYDETGIPELEKLYLDVYDYTSGKFISKSKNNKIQYEKDLKTFYKTFTGEKKLSYKKWNKDKNKKFSDIHLTDFSDSKLCHDENSAWRKTYVGSGNLFKKYAEHLKNMTAKAQKNQKDLLAYLDKIFIWQKMGKNEYLTIHPELNNKSLEKITNEVRNKILDLYFNCEKDFKEGLHIFEAIIKERYLKNAQAKTKTLENDVTDLTGNIDAPIPG